MQDQTTQTAVAFEQFQLESINQAMAKYKQAEEASRVAQAIRVEVIASIKPIIEYFNIKPDELGLSPNPPRSLPPKFLNPETGETWHGQGKRPSWIPRDLKAKDLEQFRIKN